MTSVLAIFFSNKASFLVLVLSYHPILVSVFILRDRYFLAQQQGPTLHPVVEV